MQLKKIGRFTVRTKIGENERGIVYLAQDDQNQREVAVKLLKSQFLYTLTAERKFQERAERLRGLDHPAILPLYDFGDEDNRPFLVMPLMPGGNLAERLRGGPLSPEEVIQIFTPLAEALDYCAGLGVFHHDLKPSNILFDDMDRPYLGDLGVLQIIEDLSTAKAPQANPFYISPEQVRDRPVEARTHVYSLAAMIYESLTGQPVFSGASPMVTTFKHVSENPRRPRQLRPDLPEAFDQVLLKALEKRPAERYPTCRLFLRALESARAGRLPPELIEEFEQLAEREPRSSDTVLEPVIIDLDSQPIADSSPQIQPSTGAGRRGLVPIAVIAVGIACASLLGVTCLLTLLASSTDTSQQGTQTAQAGLRQQEMTREAVVELTRSAFAARRSEAMSWPLVLADSFADNANDWIEGSEEDEFARLLFSIDGKYTWQTEAKQGFIWRVWPDAPATSDFYLAVEAQRISGDLDTQYGLIFRNSESRDAYYVFEIRDTQEYRFLVREDGEWIILIEMTASDAIRPAGINRLEVVAQGEQFLFYINGEAITQWSDSTLSEGEAGVTVTLLEAGQEAIIEFDNFELRAP